MATLRPTTTIGGGVSSLLRTAGTLAGQVATYQDAQAAFDFANSGYTDEAYAAYSDHLNGRISNLTTAGGISNSQKALSMLSTLRTATRSNTSATIARENIQVMAGNAKLSDKYNVIVSQYVRATGNGDFTLAQSLMSQAYTVNQTIAYQAQVAADAGVALGKANATAKAAGETGAINAIDESLKQLNSDIKALGGKAFNNTIATWVKTNSKVLEALGVKLKPGQQPNYFDIVHGVQTATYNHYVLAAQAVSSSDPEKAQGYLTKAADINNNVTTINTLAGNKTLSEISQIAAGNQQYIYNPSSQKMVQTQQTGHAVQQMTDDSGKPYKVVNPTFSGSVSKNIVLSPQQTAQMSKYNLEFSKNPGGTTGNGVQVQSTNQTPDFLKKILGPSGVTNMFSVDGNLQFTSDSTAKEGGQSVYTIVTDTNGLHAVFESSVKGDRMLGGEYGFSGKGLTPANIKTGGFGANLLKLAHGDMFKLSSDHTGVNQLIAQAQQKEAAVTAANQKAAAAMIALPVPALPNIAINNVPAPPPINMAPPPSPATKSVSQAAPVASPAKSPQTPGNINLQGGGVRLQ